MGKNFKYALQAKADWFGPVQHLSSKATDDCHIFTSNLSNALYVLVFYSLVKFWSETNQHAKQPYNYSVTETLLSN